MHAGFDGVRGAEVPGSAAAELRCIGVGQFDPATGHRDADLILRSGYGRGVGHHEHRSTGEIGGFAQKRDHAGAGIGGIDPFEAAGIAIELVQGGL